jgi:hypothetical protein
VAGLALVAGLLAVAGCLVVGRLMLPTGALNTAHGYALVSICDSPTLRAALGSVRYIVLSALLSLGLAIAVRDTAVSIRAVLGLPLHRRPILAHAVIEPATATPALKIIEQNEDLFCVKARGGLLLRRGLWPVLAGVQLVPDGGPATDLAHGPITSQGAPDGLTPLDRQG